MSYANIDTKEISNNILHRKEFYALKNRRRYTPDETIIPLYMVERELAKSNALFFHSYQLFVQNFINIHTPYTRLLLKHSTGSGKTLCSIGIAMQFIEYFKKEEKTIARDDIGSIYIIAFEGAQRAFKTELLRFPQLGFITPKELGMLEILKKKAILNTIEDRTKVASYGSKLINRLSNRKGNGYFKFIGYQALVNELFIRDGLDLSNMSETEILNSIKDGKLKINKKLVKKFRNSLVICDEIHNVYNSSTKNNWGIALQILLDSSNTTRAVFMSATPINNNPTEIVDLLNLLLPADSRIHKNSIFDNSNLKEEAIPLLRRLCTGRVSYLIDKNPVQYPERIFLGETISTIKHLKFIKCKLTARHLAAYKECYNEEEKTINQANRYVLDIILPSPEQEGKFIYNSEDIKKITMADDKWLVSNNITIADGVISGECLNINNLKNISNKYFIMLNNIISLIRDRQGKIMIFHNYVEVSGTMFIKEILLRNGILDEETAVSPNTLCSICGLTNQEHVDTKKTSTEHTFKPVRFIMLHSDLANNIRSRYIDQFNLSSNSMGENIMIIIGSKVLKESIELKAVRHLMVMHRPDNIPTLIQILGRAVRKNSHIVLPVEMRQVYVSLYIVTRDDGIESYDELKYADKMKDYNIIQRIEKIMHEEAIDSVINMDIIAKSSAQNEDIGDLPYTPTQDIKVIKPEELNLDTFNVYYVQREIDLVTYMIKRAFIETSYVWTFSDLLLYIKNPNFNVEYDTTLISDCSINIALSQLLWTKSYRLLNTTRQTVIENMLDISDKRIITRDGSVRVIKQIDNYYMLLPLVNGRIVLDTDILYRNSSNNNNVLSISINRHLQTVNRDIASYKTKKNAFKKKYGEVSIDLMTNVLCEYGIHFHSQFIEECIEYVFKNRIGLIVSNEEYHAFYFKMLYYYDIVDMIVFANTAKSYIYNLYTNFINTEQNETSEIVEKRNNINNLDNRIKRAGCVWCPRISKNTHTKNIKKANVPDIEDGKKLAQRKINPEILPIGHFIRDSAYFYLPDKGWFPSPEYIADNKQWLENPIIIGFNVKSNKASIRLRFKLRNPIQNITQHKDNRLIEKGSTCSSYNKEKLLTICNQLEIKIVGEISISEICTEIYARLLYLELIERTQGTNIKFFYSHYETHAKK